MPQAVGSQPLSWQAAALLGGADRRTPWVVVVAATLPDPPPRLVERIAAVAAVLPLVGARLRGRAWAAGTPAVPLVLMGDPIEEAATFRPFDLAAEPPVRVIVGQQGHRVAVAGHHAAFDGLGLVAILRALLGGPVPQPAPPRTPGRAEMPWPALRRLVRPASRVPPSPVPPATDAVAVAEVSLQGGGITARLADACVAATAARARALGAPWRSVGVSLAMGGQGPGAGYVSSYRRIDLSPGAPVARAAAAALARPEEPFALVRMGRAARLLSPLADRFSDTLLVSNVGRHDLPGASRLDFLPVARGRSAVAFGAAGLEHGPSTLAIRARDLDPADARALLDDAVRRLGD